MTNEQREAIETMQHWIEYEKEHKNEINKADELIHIQEIVLSLIKEQQEEIEKKDMIIEESIKYINSNNYVDSEECQFQWDFKIKKCIGNGDCKECIKQYFETKAKKGE